MKKLILVLLIPFLAFGQARNDGLRGTGMNLSVIRSVIADSNLFTKSGADTVMPRANLDFKAPGARFTEAVKFDGIITSNSNIVLNGTVTTQLKVTDGTAALPALAFTNDPTTGLFRNSTTGGLGVGIRTIQRGIWSKGGKYTFSTSAADSLAHVTIVATNIGAALDTLKSLKLINTTAAAAEAQQVSPGIILESQGWKTNATAGPQYTQWSIYNVPAQSTAAPLTRLYFDSKVGAGAWINRMYIASNGDINAVSYNCSNATYLGPSILSTTSATGLTIKNANASGDIILSAGNAECARFLAAGNFSMTTAKKFLTGTTQWTAAASDSLNGGIIAARSIPNLALPIGPTFVGTVKRSVTAGITAVNPGAQGDGVLVNDINEVSTVGTASDAITLPAAVAGMEIFIINNGANTLEIWPNTDDDLGAGVNTATTLAAGSNVTFVAYNGVNWEIK